VTGGGCDCGSANIQQSIVAGLIGGGGWACRCSSGTPTVLYAICCKLA